LNYFIGSKLINNNAIAHIMNNEILKLRHKLHQNPEVSNNEFVTAETISAFINKFSPDEVHTISKTGKAFVFKGKNLGKTLIFRAELDALPIAENSKLEYKSKNNNVSHLCGHDGHMAIVAGLAQRIAENPPLNGKVVLLFQPAEEVEQGAKDVIEDAEFLKINPHYIFALHNIPGVESKKIILKKGSFAAASKGMTVKLYGKTSHAAEPENGISPANAIALIIQQLNYLSDNKILFKDLTLLTIIHIVLGEISFGTSPGYAEIRVTLRAFENDDMLLLTKKSEQIIKNIALNEKLLCDISYSEIFPATVNSDVCFEIIKESAFDNNLEIEYIDKPYKWSEDFAYYAQKYKSGFFGLGAGTNHSQLHNPDYDFPDEIIESGINMFYGIYKKINL